jgi:hypothetical protein
MPWQPQPSTRASMRPMRPGRFAPGRTEIVTVGGVTFGRVTFDVGLALGRAREAKGGHAELSSDARRRRHLEPPADSPRQRPGVMVGPV